MRLVLYTTVALLLTLVIELPLAIAIKKKQAFLPALLGNLLTNPLVNLILTAALAYLGKAAYYILLPILEISAFVLEGFLYHAFIPSLSKKNALLFSLLLNFISFGVGLLIGAAI